MPPAALHGLVELSRFVAQAFIDGLWQGFVLVSAVALLLRLAPGLSAAARYAIWWFAFALGVAIPLLHLPAFAMLSHETSSVQLSIGSAWGTGIAMIWAAFMAYRAAQLLIHTLTLCRIWKRATPLSADIGISSILHAVTPSAQLCTSDDVGSPCVIGFFLPRLLIPTWLFAKLAPSELEQIVLHESEHLRRHDDWVNLLQKISLVLFPLNPALFWMDRKLSLEREIACDAGVIASTKSRFDYARCLTRLAEYRLLHRGVALSLSAWERRSELARRVHHLLLPARHTSRLRARFSSALICVGLMISGVGMAGLPHLLSFSATESPAAQAANTVAIPETIRPVPVVYRPAAETHPALKSTLMHKKMHRTRHDIAPQLRSIRAKATKRSRPQLVLTTFTVQANESNGTGQLSRLLHFAPLYTAVQIDNGWLIVQL